MTDASRPADLPVYADPDIKSALLAAGASGTIYSLVMPESEAALAQVVGSDGDERREALLDLYREPWTQKQDAMHETWFDAWLAWSSPIVALPAELGANRYPTAGASEGIYKLSAEYAAACHAGGREPVLHMFDGEYEGFPAYAEALRMRVVRHDRSRWADVPDRVDPHGLFWISQPSAIDGAVWPQFEAFAAAMAERRPEAQLVPDLTYVGSVARPFRVSLDFPNIPAVVISHSKPFGGYYHRVGGVLARDARPSLFGNKWFKNLLSLAWATEMMARHNVFDLPRRYRPVQEEAVAQVGAALGVDGLAPADVLLLGTAPAAAATSQLLRSVLRGSSSDQVVRLCVTAAMTCLIDPAMAPRTAAALHARRKADR